MRVVVVGTFAVALSLLPAQAQKNAIGMEFVKIPAGELMMGCSPGDRVPRTSRILASGSSRKAFEMGKYEVTQANGRPWGIQ